MKRLWDALRRSDSVHAKSAPKPAPQKRKRLWNALRPLLVPALALALAALADLVFLIVAYVPSGSMQPAIPERTMVVGLRGAYRTRQPERGDIIFFRHAELGRGMIVKRVIALPGQTVELRQGRVYLDGVLLEEPYITAFSADGFGPLTVPERCCFVLGDNRAASKDARFWEDPFVSFDEIEGKAFWVCFPQIRRLSEG